MDRNNQFLKFLFISVAFATLMNCLGKEDKENILDLPDYNPRLEEAIGEYYFLPIQDEFRDDFKYFKLEKGDTLLLDIKKDSTYSFNRFYYDRKNNGTFYENARHKINLSGKLIIEKNSVGISPISEVKDAKIFFSGFKKSKQNELYYYYAINSPTDPSYYEYYILFKKK